MESTQDLQQEQDWEEGKGLIRKLAQTDGTLVSPIDLVLGITKPVSLEKLRWLNFDLDPTKLKVTNTGETAIVSGKWEQIRPYLNRGPLDANYVFSQMHFHWGKDEHEGSEHTAGGIKYPLEMHVVFFKTGYLTQQAALKHDDGIVTVVYLIKLQDKSTPGLQMLTAHLDQVTQPHTSTLLPLIPLSCLLVPFTKDYFLYWGSIATSRCSHKVLWLVSRAALGITAEDLNKFRSLLDSKREQLCRNFRTTMEAQGRTVLHVCPSVDKKHLLHPGTVDPPGKPGIMVVNYTHVPTLDSKVAERVFNKGDYIGDGSDKTSKGVYHNSTTKPEKLKSNIFTKCLSRRCSMQFLSKKSKDTIRRRRSPSVISSVKSSDSTCSRRYSPKWGIAQEILRSKSQKRSEIASRKILETERKLELQKLKLELIKRREEVLAQEYKALKLSIGSNRSFFSSRTHQPYPIRTRAEQFSNITIPSLQPKKDYLYGSQNSLLKHVEYSENYSEDYSEREGSNGEDIIDNNSTVEKFKKLMMVLDRAYTDKQDNNGEKVTTSVKPKFSVPINSNTNKRTAQTSEGQHSSNPGPSQPIESKPKSGCVKRQRVESMKTPFIPRSKQGENGKTMPRLVTTIPKPIGIYSGNTCEKLDNSNSEKESMEQTLISKTSSNMLCELCYC